MKKYLMIVALLVFASVNAQAVTATVSVKAARAGAVTSLSSSALASVVTSHAVSCTANTFTVGTPSSGSASVKCYDYTEATEAECNATAPSGATSYETDKNGTTDQWAVTVAGRSGNTTTYSDFNCPSGFTVKRQSGLDLCYKVTNVTPTIK